MMPTEHYGTEWRDWPGGCPCHGEGRGYFMNYRSVFESVFAVVDRYFLLVAPDGDVGEVFVWSFGAFSWTPDGDLFERIGSGICATRARAEAECRRAADNFVASVKALA